MKGQMGWVEAQLRSDLQLLVGPSDKVVYFSPAAVLVTEVEKAMTVCALNRVEVKVGRVKMKMLDGNWSQSRKKKETKILIYQQKTTIRFLLSQMYLSLVEFCLITCSSYKYLWSQVGTRCWQTEVLEMNEFIVKSRDNQKTQNYSTL